MVKGDSSLPGFSFVHQDENQIIVKEPWVHKRLKECRETGGAVEGSLPNGKLFGTMNGFDYNEASRFI